MFPLVDRDLRVGIAALLRRRAKDRVVDSIAVTNAKAGDGHKVGGNRL